MNTVNRKICMLGDFAVGKTSLVERFVYHRFASAYLSSIGVNIYRKTIDISTDHQVQLMIWDLAGGEKLDKIMDSYLQGSTAAVIVSDLCRSNTVKSVEDYIHRFLEYVPDKPIVIAGNKCDLSYKKENVKALSRLGNEYQAPVLTTSAKTGQAVEDCFRILAQEIEK